LGNIADIPGDCGILIDKYTLTNDHANSKMPRKFVDITEDSDEEPVILPKST
jgi:hypothetical protein